jgi:tetratricopeptide (TPR) repeat protein
VLGFCYARTRQFQKTFEAFDRAQTLDPDNWAVIFARADLHRHLGQLDAARAVLGRIPSQVGKTISGSVPLLRWRLAFLSRDYASALPIAQSMPASTDPRDAGDKELQLGRTELALGQQEKAMRDLDEAVRKAEAVLNFRPPEMHERLARIHASRGDRAAAIAEADKAVQLVPLDKFPEEGLTALEAKAEVHAQLGDSNEAIALLQQIFSSEGSGVVISEALSPSRSHLGSNPQRSALPAALSGQTAVTATAPAWQEPGISMVDFRREFRFEW